MSNTRGLLHAIIRVPLIFLLMLSPTLHADEAATKPVDNIGFIKNPPQALKDQFPMCDAFLNVEWIDKNKNIGYSHFNFYIGDRTSKKRAFALIDIDKRYPRFDYDLDEYRKEGQLHEIFAFIKVSKAYFPEYALFLDGKNRPSFLQGNHDPRLGDFPKIELDSLTKNIESVCIPYPDNQRMWIAEGKMIEEIGDIEDDCGIDRYGGFDYLTTDGQDIYLNNKCRVSKFNWKGK